MANRRWGAAGYDKDGNPQVFSMPLSYDNADDDKAVVAAMKKEAKAKGVRLKLVMLVYPRAYNMNRVVYCARGVDSYHQSLLQFDIECNV